MTESLARRWRNVTFRYLSVSCAVLFLVGLPGDKNSDARIARGVGLLGNVLFWPVVAFAAGYAWERVRGAKLTFAPRTNSTEPRDPRLNSAPKAAAALAGAVALGLGVALVSTLTWLIIGGRLLVAVDGNAWVGEMPKGPPPPSAWYMTTGGVIRDGTPFRTFQECEELRRAQIEQSAEYLSRLMTSLRINQLAALQYVVEMANTRLEEVQRSICAPRQLGGLR